MNTFIKATVIALCLIGAATTAHAQSSQTQPPIISDATQYSGTFLSPFNLVQLAYRGSLASQGIPSYQAFDTEYLSGKITAEGLIQHGIAAQLVNPQAMKDPSYLSAVESQLIRFRSRVF
jgi:hypothetical protein